MLDKATCGIYNIEYIKIVDCELYNLMTYIKYKKRRHNYGE